MTLITTALPDVVSLRAQSNTSPGTRLAAIDPPNASFSMPVQKLRAFSRQSQQDTLAVFPQGYANTPALAHHAV